MTLKILPLKFYCFWKNNNPLYYFCHETERNRGGNAKELVDKQVEFSFAYGQAIKKQAEENGFITIKTSPIETLFDRTIKILEN